MGGSDVFSAFTRYDFDNDERFKAGVSSILKKQEGNKDDMLEKAKWFYYTKFIEPFDYDEYQRWKLKEKDVTNIKIEESSNTVSVTSTANKEQVTVPPKLTFQQIVEMIETGQEIPGIRQIPNKLNEGAPSQPKLKVRPKPWEQKSTAE